jgi:hypothetical protein
MWTTDKKVKFSHGHSEVQKPPPLSPWLKLHPHLKFMRLELQPPRAHKVPILANFKADLQISNIYIYIYAFLARDR